MKVHYILIVSVFLYTCRTYVDKSKDLHSIIGDLIVKENYNIYIYKNNIAGSADRQVFIPRHYKLKLPKGIVKFYAQISENYTCIEYPSKQIICIKAKYLNDNVKEDQWKLINPDEETMEKMLSDYWEEKNYNFDNIRARNHRITKLYTNGIFSILLYNIKEKNFDHFLYMVKSIEEIKYKTPDN